MDSLEFDIKRALATSPDARMQWHRIKAELFEKYNTVYEKETFKTSLHRKLQKLRLAGDIDKQALGHQEVFYFIPKKRLDKITEELNRELAHRVFDDIWQSFSPEQRKRELKNLLSQRFQVIGILQNITKELASFMKEQTRDLISRLENPTGEIEVKYSPDERGLFLNQLRGIAEEIDRIRIPDSQDRINENELRANLNLARDFLEKIVEPKYSGNWNKAIADLMRKAIEKQKELKGGK